MKTNHKYPHLRLLSQPEYLAPSWETKDAVAPVANQSVIRKQMDRLHTLCNAVFLAIILLEVSLWQIADVVYGYAGVGGAVVLVVIGVIFGLAGAVLMFLMGTVESNVRRELGNEAEREEPIHV